MAIFSLFNKIAYNRQQRSEMLMKAIKFGMQEKNHSKGELRHIRALLSSGIDPDYRDEYGRTFLMQTVNYRRKEAMEFLLAGGADVNAFTENEHGKITALLLAINGNNGDFIAALLAAGADPEAPYENDTLLGYSVRYDAQEALAALIKGGANKDAKNVDGRTALMQAAIKGDKKAVDLLLQSGASFLEKDNKQRTAMHYAASNGTPDMLRSFIQHNADMFAKGQNGETLLHAAAVGNNVATARFLVEACGIPYGICDDIGNTPYDYAELFDECYNVRACLHNLRDEALKREADKLALKAVAQERLTDKINEGLPTSKEIQPLRKVTVRKRTR